MTDEKKKAVLVLTDNIIFALSPCCEEEMIQSKELSEEDKTIEIAAGEGDCGFCGDKVTWPRVVLKVF